LIRIRQAESKDAASLFELIQHYAAEQTLLPRTVEDVRASLESFLVAEERGHLLGCGALKLYDDEVAEIRSLCVTPGIKRRGVGRALTERLLEEAEQLGLRTVFALTRAPEFFVKCGFSQTSRENFPMKVRRDCLGCERYFGCNEKTLVVDLPVGGDALVAIAGEAVEVPA
jgi:N-acetylglutamate synthase-like GNAT family acetyltransferase